MENPIYELSDNIVITFQIDSNIQLIPKRSMKTGKEIDLRVLDKKISDSIGKDDMMMLDDPYIATNIPEKEDIPKLHKLIDLYERP